MAIDIDALIQKRKEKESAEKIEKIKLVNERREYSLNRINRDDYNENEHREKITATLDALKDFQPRRIDHWFRYDTWTVNEGLILLCGYDPRKTNVKSIDHMPVRTRESPIEKRELFNATRLDGLALDNSELEEIYGYKYPFQLHLEFISNFNLLSKLWKSGQHNQDRFEAKYFIQWAINKKINITWLEWAISNKIYEDKLTDSNIKKKNNLKEGSAYPWGSHSTILLEHLSGAADKFWRLYDPLDPGTAPTNTQVQKWLVSQGVSSTISAAMATILRVDGLKTGRRN